MRAARMIPDSESTADLQKFEFSCDGSDGSEGSVHRLRLDSICLLICAATNSKKMRRS